MSKPEDELAFQLDAVGIWYQREYKFHPTRRWRADFYIKPMILVEVEGGVFVRGGHTRGVGYTRNCEKYNEAQIMQFWVLRFTPDQIKNGYALETIERAIEVKQEWNRV